MWNLRPGNVFNNFSKESQPIIMLIPEHAILEFPQTLLLDVIYPIVIK